MLTLASFFSVVNESIIPPIGGPDQNNKLIPSLLPSNDKKDLIQSTSDQITRKKNLFYKPQKSEIKSALLPTNNL